MHPKPIDWSKFCDDELSRYDLQHPRKVGDKVVATDGRILIVAEAADYPEIGPRGGRFPKFDEIIAPISRVTEWCSVPAISPCDACNNTGKIFVNCHTCGGTGDCLCDCGHEHDCCACGGEGKVFRNEYCLFCSPRVYGLKIQRQCIESVADLPGVQVGITNDNPRFLVFFRFDGGYGAIASIAEDE